MGRADEDIGVLLSEHPQDAGDEKGTDLELGAQYRGPSFVTSSSHFPSLSLASIICKMGAVILILDYQVGIWEDGKY